MTREEAIKTLKELWRETNDPWYEEVYNMAINALEVDYKTEPSCDTCKLKDTTEWCKRQEVCRAYKPKDEPQTERSE